MSLRDHYLHTTYRVTEVDPAIDIRIGQPCPPLDALLDQHAARCWAFITAWNPGSKKREPTENRKRQDQLEAEIKQAGYFFYRGAGVPDRGDWQPEDSMLIFGLNRDQALEVGKRYGQAAIVVGDRGGSAELVFLAPGSSH